MKVLQERMGHASITTTAKYYVHASRRAHREAAEAIGRVIQESEKAAQPKPIPPNFDGTIDGTRGRAADDSLVSYRKERVGPAGLEPATNGL